MVWRFGTLLLCAGLLLALGGGPATARAAALDGRILVAGSEEIELLDLSSGRVRTVVRHGNEPSFFPSGRSFAYIRSGGCFPVGGGSCYTEYSVFTKSLTGNDPTFAGRRLFGWRDFFVRALDVARGRLVFSAKRGPGPDRRGNNLDIYSAALDGTDVRQLTDNPAFENDPVVSPDGRRIAFSRRVDGRGQIFMMRMDGSHLKQLTHNRRTRSRLPSWSPNGSRLVFISQPSGQGSFARREIYTVGANGGRLRRLTHNRATEDMAVYSPDGRSIAFLNSGNLWVMNANGNRPRKILTAPDIAGYESGLDWGPAP